MVNQPPITALGDFLDSDIPSVDVDIAEEELETFPNTNLAEVAEKTEDSPVFTLTPSHLKTGCQVVKNLVPQ